MLTYLNFPDKVRSKFPEIAEEVADEEFPNVVASFLLTYIHKVVNNNRNTENIVDFINMMCLNSNDPGILSLIDEIAIGLFDKSESNYMLIRSKLDDNSKKCLDRSVEIWKKANKIF